MTNSEEDFRKKIDRLNRNFSVTSVIFNKYDNIFFQIFKSPESMETTKTHRSRKQRQVKLNMHISKLYDNTFLITMNDWVLNNIQQ